MVLELKNEKSNPQKYGQEIDKVKDWPKSAILEYLFDISDKSRYYTLDYI